MPIVSNRTIDRRQRIKPIAQAGEPKALLLRARLLPPQDRLLVELALGGQVNRRQLAVAFGVRPGTVTRRMQSLAARLCDPLIIDLLDDSLPLAPEYRQVGVEFFLQRRSAVTIGQRHRMRVTDIRQILTFLRGWHRGLRSHRDWARVVGRSDGRHRRRPPHIAVI
jgi:hypothetical protein